MMINIFILFSVNFYEAKRVALMWAEKEWGYKEVCDVMPYYSPYGDTVAYSFIFSDRKRDVEEFMREHPYKQNMTREYIKLRTGYKIFGNIIVSAKEELPPVLEISNCLPLYYTRRHIVGSQKLPLIYVSPAFQWYRIGDQLVSLFDLTKSSLKELKKVYSEAEVLSSKENRWERYFTKNKINVIETDKVEGVPALTWSYGCSPTTSAMIMWYWDKHGFDKLVDYFFDRYDPPEKDFDIGIPNVHQELAIAMHTDTMTGGTSPNNIASAHAIVGSNNGYTIGSGAYSIGSGNGWGWNIVKGEINEDRPCHWTVYYYSGPGHSVCVIGYELTDAYDSFYIVHNTWDVGEHKWALHNSNYYGDHIFTVVPQDSQDYDIEITTPLKDFVLYRGYTYPVKVSTKGVFKTIDIFLAPENGGRKDQWETIGSTDKDIYMWELKYVDNNPGRINVVMKNGSAVASEGMRYQFTIEDLNSDGFESIQHFYGNKVTALCFEYPYIIYAFSNYALIYQINSGVADFVNVVSLEENIKGIAMKKGKIYIQDGKGNINIYDEEGIFIEKIDNSSGSGKGIFIHNNYLIEILSDYGIKIYNIEDMSVEKELITSVNPITSQISGDTLYLCSSSTGVQMFDISNLPEIDSKGTLPVGTASDIAKIDKDFYMARGTKSVLHYDAVSGDTNAIEGFKNILYMGETGNFVYALSFTDTIYVFSPSGDNIEIKKKYFIDVHFSGETKHSLTYFVIPTKVGVFLASMNQFGGIKENREELLRGKVSYTESGVVLSFNKEGSIDIFDLMGRKIKENKGKKFYIKDLKQGIYFYIFKAGDKYIKNKFLIVN